MLRRFIEIFFDYFFPWKLKMWYYVDPGRASYTSSDGSFVAMEGGTGVNTNYNIKRFCSLKMLLGYIEKRRTITFEKQNDILKIVVAHNQALDQD